MRRAAWLVTPILILTLSSAPLRAVSDPVINVDALGLELCPQSICGLAIFTGLLIGQVGRNPLAIGTFVVAAQHGELPTMAGDFTPLAGPFELRFGLRRFRGMAIGTVTANDDNTFDVDATLDIQSGGSGTVQYHGRLDHNVFPPTLIGKITQ